MSTIESMKSSVLKPLALSQTISFHEMMDGSSIEVNAKEVIVRSSAGSHTTGSSKVKLKSIVDYGWESRHYPGRLVAIHMGGKYLAYGLKPAGKNVGVVRVVNRDTEARVLIRDLLGLVQDLCFAHIRSQIMLASVDHFGNLFVHQIQCGAKDNLECSLFLHVEHEGGGSALTHRVVWCPYIPEDGGQATVDDDAAKLLVVTHGAKAEMLNVARVQADIPVGEVRVRPSHLLEGRLPMEEHSGDIVEASFSPDGTALATASADGLVKFFQVYLPTESKPRCLHKWRPHGGRPLSCLFFLDDHRNHSPEVQFWKFAVTGTRNNHELKLWSCESWTCLQTIYFGEKDGPRGLEEGFLKAGLDLAARFLLLSDIGRKVLYVLQFGRDEDEGISFVSTISEFHLPYPILSFGVVNAEICHNKGSSPTAAYSDDPSVAESCKGETKLAEDEESGTEETLQTEYDGGDTVAIHIVLVQPKSLQECHITFQVGSANSSYEVDSIALPVHGSSEKSLALKDNDTGVETEEDESLLQTSVSNLQPDSLTGASPNAISFSGGVVSSAPILTLMTPDAFSSPIRREGVSSAGIMAGSHPTSLVSSPASTLSAPSSTGAPEKSTPPSAPSPHPAESRFPPPPPLDHPPCSPGTPLPPSVVSSSFVSGSKVGVEVSLSQMSSAEKKLEVSREEGDVGTGGGSGGSSPSREVQQILSLSDSPHGVDREFFDDEKGTEGKGAIGQEEGILHAREDAVGIVNQSDLGTILAVPTISEAKNETESLESVLEIPLGKPCGDSAVLAEKPAGEPCVGQDGNVEGRIGSGLASLAHEVGSLARAVRAQEERFQRLRSEIRTELSAVRSDSRWGVEEASALASMLESSLRPHLENSIDCSVRNAMDRVGPVVERAVEENCQGIRLEQDKFCREGPSGVSWDAVVHSAISRGLEPLRHQLASESAMQAESAAREGVTLALQRNSKLLVDNIVSGLLASLRPAMLEAFKQAFAAVVLPSFEKSCNHMFQQINDSFSLGTKEYGRMIEAHFERRCGVEKSKEAAAIEVVRNEACQLADAIREDIPAQIQKVSSSLCECLAQEVRTAVEEPLSRGLVEQRDWLESCLAKSLSRVVFSPASIPVSMPDAKHLHGSGPTSSPLPAGPNGAILMRTRVSELVAQGRVNEAFQMALSASDLGLVTYLCEVTSPAQVFGGTSAVGGGKCKLEQPVLLSLVQQLSANLYDHTELKMSYLAEAVFHLDMRQPELREHLAMVLSVLQKGLNSFIMSHPGSKLSKEMRMLLMASAYMLEFTKTPGNSYSFHDPSSVSLMD